MTEPDLINARIILRLRDAQKTKEHSPDLEKHIMLKSVLKDGFQHLPQIQPHHLDWNKFRARLEYHLGIDFDPLITDIQWTDITFREKTSPQDKWIVDEYDFHHAIARMYGQRPRRCPELVFVFNVCQPGLDDRLEDLEITPRTETS